MTIPMVVAVADLGDTVDGGLLGNDVDQETFLALLQLASLRKLHAANTVHVKMTRAEALKERLEQDRVAIQVDLEQASPKSIDGIVVVKPRQRLR